MIMLLNKGSIFKYQGDNFLILECIKYQEDDYVLGNKYDNNPSNIIYIFKFSTSNFVKIEDTELLNKLLPLFEQKLKEDIGDVINE